MKPVRIIVAGLVGAIIAFGWSAVSHMVLPLGEMGVKSLPAEQTLIPAMQGALHERALYIFPGMETKDASGKMLSPEAGKAAMEAWTAKYKAGPRGIVIYDPTGGNAMAFEQFGTEFASAALCAIILALMLSMTSCGFLGRATLACLVGVFAWSAVEVSYWTWYRFPTDYMLAQLADQAVGWFLAGLAIGPIAGKCVCKPAPGAAAPAA